MDGRLFGLDAQLLFDVLVMLVFIMVLFAIMSVLFFNPVRSFLEKRREALDEMAEETRKAQEQAQSLRMAYEEKLKDVDREIQILLTTKRREAFVQQENILNNAREQARLRMEAEKKAVSREKMQAQEAIMRQAEILAVLMASQFITVKHPENAAGYVADACKKYMADMDLTARLHLETEHAESEPVETEYASGADGPSGMDGNVKKDGDVWKSLSSVD